MTSNDSLSVGKVLTATALVFYLRIVVHGLLDHIEFAILPRIIANTSSIVPVAIVAAHIMVQLRYEELY